MAKILTIVLIVAVIVIGLIFAVAYVLHAVVMPGEKKDMPKIKKRMDSEAIKMLEDASFFILLILLFGILSVSLVNYGYCVLIVAGIAGIAFRLIQLKGDTNYGHILGSWLIAELLVINGLTTAIQGNFHTLWYVPLFLGFYLIFRLVLELRHQRRYHADTF